MSLIEENILWIVPGVVLSLFMVFAMMEFTVAVLRREPKRMGKPVDEATLRQRLLALNEPGKRYRLVEDEKYDLLLDWEVVDASWRRPFGKVKLTTAYGARMLLDEERHEVRWYEWVRSANTFIGFDGWVPRFNFSYFFQAGYLNVVWKGSAYGLLPGWPPRIGRVYHFSLNTIEVKKEIGEVITESGWILRPTHLWFQTRRGTLSLGKRLLPARIRQLPPQRFWGVVYPLSFVAAIGYLLLVTGAYDRDTLLVVALVSAAWWGIWGFILLVFLAIEGRWIFARKTQE